MGISAVSYQGTASCEPSSFGKVQLEQILLSYSLQIEDLSVHYRKLGTGYHDLPLHIRNHIRFPKELRGKNAPLLPICKYLTEFKPTKATSSETSPNGHLITFSEISAYLLVDLSMTAFTCSDSREIPDMIQIMNQLRERFARARAGIVCDEFSIAINQLFIAAWLVREAENRVANLTWAMACYESFIEGLKDTVGAQAYCTLYRQASVGNNVLTARALMKSKWEDALPKERSA